MTAEPTWDVAIVGGGPAGLSAAHAAASAGARTIVLERAEHPRYKTCGGGLIGASLAAVAGHIEVPARDIVHTAVFTYRGGRTVTRTSRRGPLVSMVRREEFDDALRCAAVEAGAVVRQRTAVRGLVDGADVVSATLAGGDTVTAKVVVGADGSAGITSRHVGVEFDQVDLGLEVELPVDGELERRWAGRLLIDWGPLPGSYGWVFPKGEQLTVGVIAPRGDGDGTRRYLRQFLDQLGLSGITPTQDSGHLTRCRGVTSPLRRGRVVVAGDAAGLLEPWTREGISFALRSGRLAGDAAARAALRPDGLDEQLDGYTSTVERTLGREMAAGRRLLGAFRKHPTVLHTALATPPGWRVFTGFCRGELPFHRLVEYRVVAGALRALSRY